MELDMYQSSYMIDYKPYGKHKYSMVTPQEVGMHSILCSVTHWTPLHFSFVVSMDIVALAYDNMHRQDVKGLIIIIVNLIESKSDTQREVETERSLLFANSLPQMLQQPGWAYQI